jgi:DNA-binding NtrC family response regulator
MFKVSHEQSSERLDRVGAPTSPAPVMTEPSLAGSRVLVVEDDAALALDLIASLSDANADVVGPVTDLEEAESLIGGGCCDAVILDLRVGNRNATSFAHLLLEKRIPFLIYTGYPDSAYLRLRWPGCGLLSKPAETRCVIEMLAGYIAWRKREQ